MYSKKPINRLICIEDIFTGLSDNKQKGFYFAGESHNFWEIVFVASGKITASADERIYHLNSGNLLFHKPMEYHRIWCENDDEAYVNIISFSASGKGMKYFEICCFALNESEGKQFSEITGFFSEAIKQYSLHNTEKYNYFSNLGAAFLETFLLKLTKKTEYKQMNFTESERRYFQIVNIMKQNVNEKLSVNQLAELCNMSVSNMKRIFALYSDIGVAKYFLNLKLRKARELIEKGKTTSETAETLGFDEISYFYKVFKRETGLTPTQYRRSLSV